VVTIYEFCTHYSISPADHECLDKLEYYPGDTINKLERVEWQEQARCSKLAQNQMLAKHQEFQNDVQHGLWA
jgi:hypothetical protein